jgi:two-component system LytT family response regulator
MPPVIFVTAHDAYALKAFEVHAIDYLLKPYSDDAFRDAIARAKGLILKPPSAFAAQLERLVAGLNARESSAAAASASSVSGSLCFKSGTDILFVRPEEVLWFEAEGDYVTVHTLTKRHLVQASLNGLASDLDPALFARIHRSAIVNMTRVARITPGAYGDCLLYLEDGTELRVSRNFRDGLLKHGATQSKIRGDR